MSFEGILQSYFTFQYLSVASQVHTGLFVAHPEAVQSTKQRSYEVPTKQQIKKNIT